MNAVPVKREVSSSVLCRAFIIIQYLIQSFLLWLLGLHLNDLTARPSPEVREHVSCGISTLS